jgi:hypothetical protein
MKSTHFRNSLTPFMPGQRWILNPTAWCFLVTASLLLTFSGLAFASLPPVEQQIELAGNSLAQFPFFEYVKAFNEDATVEVAVDPMRYPGIVGQTGDIYITDAETEQEWTANPTLTDVTGGPLTVTFGGSTIQENTFLVANPFDLDADAYTGLGVGYDLVIDLDQDGLLSDADYIDGLGNEAGLYAVHDVSQPGPLSVTEIIYSGGSWLGQDLYYPTDIASMGQLPLVVISHGNGHQYIWYDHIGNHLASYGYIVMSHQNNTGPGIETASTTTLTNTDYIIGNQGSIGGGVLNGHINETAIVWIGHSRGGEGITRAYDRLYDGTYTPDHFSIEEITLLSSMLPTDFLGTYNSNPHDANYHLWTASGDADVSGTAGNDIAQTFHLHDRATGFRQSTVVQGSGHGWFHDGGGSGVFTGPCPIYEENTHLIQQGYFLPLVKHYVEGNFPARDFLWRQYEHFHPIGVDLSDPCIVVTNEYRNGADTGNFFIDDFQAESSTSISSSGGTVTYTVQNLTEGRLDDNNASFSWTSSDPFNGATQCSSSSADDSKGVVFDWTAADRYIEWEIIPSQKNFANNLYLSFRGAQGTQHPNTLAVMGDLTFSVTLRDGSGTSSSINIGAYGGGLEQPYDRDGGWHNEMEVIRIRLSDFLHNGSALDLTDIDAVRLDCGPSWGSNEGRIVVDELMLTNDALPEIPGGILYPVVDIKCNGQDGSVTMIAPEHAVLEIDFLARDGAGYNAELWVVTRIPNGYYTYQDGNWYHDLTHVYHSGPLMDYSETVLDAALSARSFRSYLLLDTQVNGSIDIPPFNYDRVDFTILPEGTQIVLIWSPAGSSGPAMADAIGALGLGYEQEFGALPADLGMYAAVFVNLGIYTGNHVLTSSEGTALAAYLDGGGNVYMEGGDTWAYDSSTAVHPYFGITGLSDGSADTFNCDGIAGTFTEGMTFVYTGGNSWMDHLAPVAPAYTIFVEQTAGYDNAIAHDGGTYKTIGGSFEFGGLVDGVAPSTKLALMGEYLTFFGLTD